MTRELVSMCVNREKDSNDVLKQSFMKSRRKLVLQMYMAHLSVQKSVKKLNLWLYHIHAVHELIELDKSKCLQYCTLFQAFIKENGMKLLGRIFFSSTLWVCISQSSRILSCENPHLFYKVPPHPDKLGVLCLIGMWWAPFSLRRQLLVIYIRIFITPLISLP